MGAHGLVIPSDLLLGVCGSLPLDEGEAGVKPRPAVCRATAAFLEPEYDAPLLGPGDCTLLVPPWALAGPLACCRSADIEQMGLRAFMGVRR